MTTILNYTVSEIVRIEAVTCGTCGFVFGLPEDFIRLRHQDGRSFYCPNGHYVGYGETEHERLQQELQQAKNSLSGVRRDLASERRSHSATKGTVTKLRRRAEAGVCAYCNRTFRDYARHMATKHGEETGGEHGQG